MLAFWTVLFLFCAACTADKESFQALKYTPESMPLVFHLDVQKTQQEVPELVEALQKVPAYQDYVAWIPGTQPLETLGRILIAGTPDPVQFLAWIQKKPAFSQDWKRKESFETSLVDGTPVYSSTQKPPVRWAFLDPQWLLISSENQMDKPIELFKKASGKGGLLDENKPFLTQVETLLNGRSFFWLFCRFPETMKRYLLEKLTSFQRIPLFIRNNLPIQQLEWFKMTAEKKPEYILLTFAFVMQETLVSKKFYDFWVYILNMGKQFSNLPSIQPFRNIILNTQVTIQDKTVLVKVPVIKKQLLTLFSSLFYPKNLF